MRSFLAAKIVSYSQQVKREEEEEAKAAVEVVEVVEETPLDTTNSSTANNTNNNSNNTLPFTTSTDRLSVTTDEPSPLFTQLDVEVVETRFESETNNVMNSSEMGSKYLENAQELKSEVDSRNTQISPRNASPAVPQVGGKMKSFLSRKILDFSQQVKNEEKFMPVEEEKAVVVEALAPSINSIVVSAGEEDTTTSQAVPTPVVVSPTAATTPIKTTTTPTAATQNTSSFLTQSAPQLPLSTAGAAVSQAQGFLAKRIISVSGMNERNGMSVIHSGREDVAREQTAAPVESVPPSSSFPSLGPVITPATTPTAAQRHNEMRSFLAKKIPGANGPNNNSVEQQQVESDEQLTARRQSAASPLIFTSSPMPSPMRGSHR
eukprot:gene30382-37587_t